MTFIDHRKNNDPWICVCAHPKPDGVGECGHCHRLTLTHSFHHGRPAAALTSTPVEDIVPGAAIWDGRDGSFYFVDANPHPTAALISLTVSGVGVVDYERGVKLITAVDPREAELHNALAGERVA